MPSVVTSVAKHALMRGLSLLVLVKEMVYEDSHRGWNEKPVFSVSLAVNQEFEMDFEVSCPHLTLFEAQELYVF